MNNENLNIQINVWSKQSTFFPLLLRGQGVIQPERDSNNKLNKFTDLYIHLQEVYLPIRPERELYGINIPGLVIKA